MVLIVAYAEHFYAWLFLTIKHNNMKSSIISTIQHIRIAIEFAQDVQRNPNSRAAKSFNIYENRLQWILKDFKTNPLFPSEVREGISQEYQSDIFALEGLKEKIPLIPAQHRSDLEDVVEAILQGKTIKIEIQ